MTKLDQLRIRIFDEIMPHVVERHPPPLQPAHVGIRAFPKAPALKDLTMYDDEPFQYRQYVVLFAQVFNILHYVEAAAAIEIIEHTIQIIHLHTGNVDNVNIVLKQLIIMSDHPARQPLGGKRPTNRAPLVYPNLCNGKNTLNVLRIAMKNFTQLILPSDINFVGVEMIRVGA